MLTSLVRLAEGGRGTERAGDAASYLVTVPMGGPQREAQCGALLAPLDRRTADAGDPVDVTADQRRTSGGVRRKEVLFLGIGHEFGCGIARDATMQEYFVELAEAAEQSQLRHQHHV